MDIHIHTQPQQQQQPNMYWSMENRQIWGGCWRCVWIWWMHGWLVCARACKRATCDLCIAPTTNMYNVYYSSKSPIRPDNDYIPLETMSYAAVYWMVDFVDVESVGHDWPQRIYLKGIDGADFFQFVVCCTTETSGRKSQTKQIFNYLVTRRLTVV